MLKKHFGSRIKEIREAIGINQEQLAESIGMESRHISRIETGKSFTTIENISNIATALNVNIEDLFSFQHKKEPTILIEEINELLSKADNKKIELIYRLVQAVMK